MNTTERASQQIYLPWSGLVRGLYIALSAGAPMLSLRDAFAVEGRGIQGDRYFLGVGTHSSGEDDEPGYQVTLIERETIMAISREKHLTIEEDVPRRNIVTEGVGLNHLVHRTFRIGEAVLYGVALREPCIHLAEVTSHRLMVSLLHRGGLGATVVRGGMIRIGDLIQEA